MVENIGRIIIKNDNIECKRLQSLWLFTY